MGDIRYIVESVLLRVRKKLNSENMGLTFSGLVISQLYNDVIANFCNAFCRLLIG